MFINNCINYCWIDNVSVNITLQTRLIIFKMRQEPKQQIQNSHSKLDRYRSQIRKTSIKSRIEQERKQLVGHLDFQTLKSLLHNLDRLHFPKNGEEIKKQHPNTDQLIDMINILEQHCQQASFNLQAATQNLGEGFANIFLVYAKTMLIEDKTKLLSALAYLTYYSQQSSAALVLREEFIDFLRTQLNSLSMQKLLDIKFSKMIVILLMNLASLRKQQFNIYLAESDVCKCINEQISKTYNICKHNQNYQYIQSVKQLREFALRLFKNVISALDKSLDIVVKLVASAIKDEVYFLEHPDRMFNLLQQAMQIDKFWSGLMQSDAGDKALQYIAEASLNIQQNCLTDDFLKNNDQTLTQTQELYFYTMLCFLNKLNFQDEQDPCNTFVWSKFVEELLNGFMLAEFTKKAHFKRKKEHLRVALTTYCHLSRSEIVTGEQLVIVRPSQDVYILLKVFADPLWVISSEVGSLCWQILKNLLSRSKEYRKQLMELLIVDRMVEVLESELAKPSLLIELILFGRELLRSFDESTDKILQVYQNKKIIQRIDKLIGHNNRQVFEKAEMFIEAVGAEQRKFQRPI